MTKPISLTDVRDLLVEADGLEAHYGPNPYVDYLRAHHRRPPPTEAATMGKVMGGRVRADDGTMQPPKARKRKRPGDDMPIHRKLGYDQMVEMADIRAALVAKGVTGTRLHFDAAAIYEARHKGDPTFKERQAAWLARQKSAPRPDDSLIQALILIRDGHNDPRGLAREVLALAQGDP